ncbi:MAG TPA: PIG-L deacetylase family protein [Armatimonadota bacterium]|jgi:LmbE family N-acetylglucosaminyl deacetylase
MKILIIGAHEDDPECGAGGLALKAVKKGHSVKFLYLTNGEKYGFVPEGASRVEVRESEARAAAAFCGAEPHFFGYKDREIAYEPSVLKRVRDFIIESQADLVIAQWPADQHPDHQVCGILATQAVIGLDDVGLAYYESSIGVQSFGMVANRYIDISDVYDDKKRMIAFHQSQIVENLYKTRDHIEKWYGARMRVQYAEGYYMHKSTQLSEELFLP